MSILNASLYGCNFPPVYLVLVIREFPNFQQTAEQAEDVNWIYHYFFSCRSFLLMTALVDDIHFNQFASVLLKDSVRSLINHL